MSSSIYTERRLQGLCGGCGKQPDNPKYSTCDRCRALGAKRQRDKFDRGLCVCGKRPPRVGSKLCEECADYRRRRFEERRAGKKCQRCGEGPLRNNCFCWPCSEKNLAVARARASELRARAIEAYGGKCNCCDETRREFLCIDHINNDGAEHRKTLKSSIYKWLADNNYPPGFQILCCNCNSAKEWYGTCPHQWPTKMLEVANG